jgi:hypothetical protein
MTNDLELTYGQGKRLDSIDSWGFWRLAFWFAYALSSFGFVFSFFLALVPRDLCHPDFSLDYILRGCVCALATVSIVLARWIWKIRRPLGIRIKVWTAWIELAVAWIQVIAIFSMQLA